MKSTDEMIADLTEWESYCDRGIAACQQATEAWEAIQAMLEKDMNQREYVYECNKAIEEAKRTA